MASGSKAKRLFWPLLQRPALKAAACFHATAIQEYEDIRRLGFTQPVAVIPNGVDPLECVEPTGPKKHEVLYLGRLHPKKGIDNLLSAWAVVQSEFPYWDLIIAGPDESYGKGDHYAKYLKNLATQLGLVRVQFAGPLYGQEKFKAYSNASLFVLPTHSENFGVTVAEALISGTPAIVTRGAPWDRLAENTAGWWIDIGVAPLVACLRRAMSLPLEQLASMGRSGANWMRKDYSWDQLGRMMLHTYLWLLGNGPLPKCVIID